MKVNYNLIDDGECSYKIEWLDKKPPMTSMENFLRAYKDMEFMSTSGTSSQYVEFGRDLKKVLKKIFGAEYNIETSIGHFEVSGFISKDDNYCYFSIGDLRFDSNWYNNVLYRTAENNKDYRGGDNMYCSCEKFEYCVKRMLERGF